MGTKTERLIGQLDVEAVFRAFVHNANALASQSRTRRAGPGMTPIPSELALPPVVSLKSVSIDDRRGADLDDSFPSGLFDASTELYARPEPDSAEPIELIRRTSRPPPPGSAADQREAKKLVPDVATIAPRAAPVPEGSEDGEIPPRELERVLGDMAVLLRYGHVAEVGQRVDELLAKYPEDLLLLRRIAEFHLEMGSIDAAKECLFRLARGLFDRRNVHGMRAALEQVVVLDPNSSRAQRLLGLLERRDS